MGQEQAHAIQFLQQENKMLLAKLQQTAGGMRTVMVANDCDEAHMAFSLFKDVAYARWTQHEAMDDDDVAYCFDQAARWWDAFKRRANDERERTGT
jgi:hypothetical protein